MKCEDVQEGLGVYWDLPEHDDQRRAIDEHVAHCKSCREEFDIWQESTTLIRDTMAGFVPPAPAPTPRPVASKVMERIYSDESWRIPVPEKMYSFSYKMRRSLTALVAFCMTLFIFGFTMSVFGGGWMKDDALPSYGLKPVASASADAQAASKAKSFHVEAAVASLKDPYLVRMGPIRTVPDYMIVLSLLGFTATILIMNWLSRTRA